MSYEARCHCGAFRLSVPYLPAKATRCNCSWCARVGGLWGYYAPDEVTIISASNDRIYDPSNMKRHHFCGTCSGLIYNDIPKWDPQTNRPTEVRQISVNLRMIDDPAVNEIPVREIDGKNGW